MVERDDEGNTVLYYAAENPESVTAILELLPENDHITLLPFAIERPELLRAVLEFYPENERLALVINRDGSGDTILHEAVVEYPDSFRVALELLPQNARLAAVIATDAEDNTVLHKVADDYPETLRIALELLIENDRTEALHATNGNNTVLNLAANNPASLETALELIPQNQRFAALLERNDQRYTVLEQVVMYEQGKLKAILQLFYRDITDSNLNGISRLLDYVASNSFNLLTQTNFDRIIRLNGDTADSVLRALETPRAHSEILLPQESFSVLISSDRPADFVQGLLTEQELIGRERFDEFGSPGSIAVAAAGPDTRQYRPATVAVAAGVPPVSSTAVDVIATLPNP